MSKNNEHDGLDLRGTLASVMVVGVIIVVMWVVVYMMYLGR
ncbi:cytochrome C oxidase subunit II [Planococcus halotolerans]|uniref:Cytochrome C oxidase subunit II n=1 Tax=Planococcus halotolerans TaxID=2233542 RepID=A0A365L7M1_9BACL|nr:MULTISPECIES: cytochrome C oxidase subunit II [Planococcaceae]QHJ69886.1 cytochrome C oxidase subunit II [Planococcus halotolerans]RAZ81424.1 cytochrome C oxidase subunit II [Planococcus halotolerans]RLQ89817.1 cytochrome C oxidase subunit II [Planomicrobium sp. Y74]